MQKYRLFFLKIFIDGSAENLMRKKSEGNEQSLEDLSSAHRRSQAKFQRIQTSCIKRIKFFLFAVYSGTSIKGTKDARYNEVSFYSTTSI